MIHETAIQLRFADIDKLGHVNNACYLTYFETARISFFDDHFADLIDWEKKGLILAKAEVSYFKPLLLTDKPVVLTWCTRIGTKSFDLSYRILDKKTNSKIAEGTTVLVAFDYVDQISFPVPSEWKNVLEQLKQ